MKLLQNLISFEELSDRDLEIVSGGGRYYQASISMCTNSGYVVAIQSLSNPKQVSYTRPLNPSYANFLVGYINKNW